jgi:hypothetical protein
MSLVEAEKDFEIKKLKAQISELEKENDKLNLLLKEADPEASANMISDSEYICLNEIRKLREISKTGELSADEVKAFDTLHKNLNIIQGKNPRKLGQGSTKNMSDEDLEKLLNG